MFQNVIVLFWALKDTETLPAVEHISYKVL